MRPNPYKICLRKKHKSVRQSENVPTQIVEMFTVLLF